MHSYILNVFTGKHNKDKNFLKRTLKLKSEIMVMWPKLARSSKNFDFADSPKQEFHLLHDKVPFVLHLNLEKQ